MNCPKTDLAHGKEVADALGIGLSELPAKPMITCTSSPGKRRSRKGRSLNCTSFSSTELIEEMPGFIEKSLSSLPEQILSSLHQAKQSVAWRSLSGGIPSLRNKFHPVEYSALIHLGIVSNHPFGDGNGRAARLLMNLALLQAEYVITIIPVLFGFFRFCLGCQNILKRKNYQLKYAIENAWF